LKSCGSGSVSRTLKAQFSKKFFEKNLTFNFLLCMLFTRKKLISFIKFIENFNEKFLNEGNQIHNFIFYDVGNSIPVASLEWW
jgi:hypothetical protein